MDKTKSIINIIVIVVSIALVIGISIKLLDTTGIINQGNFRVNDFVVTSIATVEEKEIPVENVDKTQGEQTEEKKEEDLSKAFSNVGLNISQNNKLSMLITKDMKMESMYIDNIKITSPAAMGKITIHIKGQEVIEYNGNIERIDITPEQKDEQYYLELDINNVDIIKEAKIPEGTKVIKYDGTLLELLGKKASDVEFNISFDLNIIDETNKKNVAKINLKVPNQDLINNGISVIRENTSNYIFSLR